MESKRTEKMLGWAAVLSLSIHHHQCSLIVVCNWQWYKKTKVMSCKICHSLILGVFFNNNIVHLLFTFGLPRQKFLHKQGLENQNRHTIPGPLCECMYIFVISEVKFVWLFASNQFPDINLTFDWLHTHPAHVFCGVLQEKDTTSYMNH